ncbi:MAG: winged helix-turn-helix domain-containing protein [Halioglobus sp.]
MSKTSLSLHEARRLCLAAQGFDRPRPSRSPDRRHLRQAINRMGILQLDFVNVLVPAHYLVLFSRLGPYDRKRVNELIYQGRDYIEHWAHEASIVPTELWSLLAYRRAQFEPWKSSPIMKLPSRKSYLKNSLEQVRSQGPITAQDLPPVPRPAGKPGDWEKSVGRWALECHFGNGDVSVADRLPNFQRVYDVPENIVDEPHLSKLLSKEDGQRELLYRAAGAYGVASLHDLADYYRMPTREAAPLIAELLEEGKLEEVSVESWSETAYRRPDTKVPRKIEASSLLSPFDPLVWFRPRAERLFGFHYRIEIYVPANKRKWGYYVLPFLHNDKIVARVDLKAQRDSRTLLVLASHEEPESDTDTTTVALAKELWTLARWLELDTIKVTRRGKLGRALAQACRTRERT